MKPERELFERKWHLVEFYDVWMTEELQILDLPPDLAHHVQVLDLLPVEDLDCNLVASQLVKADLHLAKGADAKSLAQDVMTNLDLEEQNDKKQMDANPL